MNVSMLCRSCMKKVASWEKENFNKKAVDMFCFCTDIEVIAEDKMPKQFCYDCFIKIESSYTFITDAQKVDVALRNILSRTDTSVIVKYDNGYNHDQNLVSEQSNNTPYFNYDSNTTDMVLTKSKDYNENLESSMEHTTIRSELPLHHEADVLEPKDTSQQACDVSVEDIDKNKLNNLPYFNYNSITTDIVLTKSEVYNENLEFSIEDTTIRSELPLHYEADVLEPKDTSQQALDLSVEDIDKHTFDDLPYFNFNSNTTEIILTKSEDYNENLEFSIDDTTIRSELPLPYESDVLEPKDTSQQAPDVSVEDIDSNTFNDLPYFNFNSNTTEIILAKSENYNENVEFSIDDTTIRSELSLHYEADVLEPKDTSQQACDISVEDIDKNNLNNLPYFNYNSNTTDIVLTKSEDYNENLDISIDDTTIRSELPLHYEADVLEPKDTSHQALDISVEEIDKNRLNDHPYFHYNSNTTDIVLTKSDNYNENLKISIDDTTIRSELPLHYEADVLEPKDTSQQARDVSVKNIDNNKLNDLPYCNYNSNTKNTVLTKSEDHNENLDISTDDTTIRSELPLHYEADVLEPKDTSQQACDASVKDIDKKNICPTCNKNFTSATWLARHLLTQHQDVKYPCGHCIKTFSKPHLLHKHLSSHTKPVLFGCKLCSKKYKRRKQLIRHMKTHRDDRPYICDICQTCFKLRGVLLSHMKLHEEEKKFLCNLCGRSFTQGSNLAVHMRTHTGEKPYKCKQCPFQCSVSSNMQRHLRGHVGEKLYLCFHCAKSFNDAGGLVRHNRRHTGELPFKCPYCPQSFIDSWKRKNHMMRLHDMTLDDIPRMTRDGILQ